MGVWVRQLQLCLTKDYIIAKRNSRSTLISILVPIVFVFFIVVLQFAFNNNERFSKLIKPVHEGVLNVITPIPHCISVTGTPCITIAYAPRTDATATSIMTRILTINNLKSSDMMGFDTSDDLDRYLLSNPNTTQGAYNFFVQRDGSGRPVGVRYVVQYNQTTTAYRGVTYDSVQGVLLPMQKAADMGIMKELMSPKAIDVDYNFISYPHPETLPFDVAAAYGPSFFFGALMFNFVIQLGRLVSEKELNLRASMKLMGLRDSVYWVAAFIVVLTYNFISTLVLSVAGLAFQLKFFIKNDFALYFLLFFLFGLAMTPLVLLLAVFVSKSKTATVLGFGVFLVGTIVQGFASLVFVKSVEDYYRIPFSFLPFALLAKGMNDLAAFSSTEDSVGMRWAERDTNVPFFPLTSTYGWLLIDTATFALLAIYLDQIIPNDNGICQVPWFFLTKSYWFPNSVVKSSVPLATEADFPTDEAIDEDVMAEMKDAIRPDNTAPFRVINLQKTFWGKKMLFFSDPKKDFHAVRGVYLVLQPNTLFCLLGHNGAGKTTTLNALTGLTLNSHGDAIVLGKSIVNSMSDVQKSMGVCPQYDILWAQMTAREHLQLFAGLKQLSASKIDEEVEERLKDVDLTKDADNIAGNFSGGMQRRLSVAIALTGNPEIVYLDEPTTGMDPVSRRKVWNLIERIKRKRITILTTHSMEEADILADRIGIMHQGRFACIGNSLHLKQKFGSGYRITVRADNATLPAINAFFVSRLKGSVSMGVEDGAEKFNVPRQCMDLLPQFFTDLELRRQEYGIQDIQLSLSTLEEVFLKIGGLGEHDERVGDSHDKPVAPKTCRQRCKAIKAWQWLALLVVIFLLFVILGMAFKPADVPVANLVVLSSATATLAQLVPNSWTELAVPLTVSSCARGDTFSFFVKKNSATKLIIEFEGGGVCYDASSCGSFLGKSSFNASITNQTERVPLQYGNRTGIFQSRTDNPYSQYSHVYIPLCTADSFLGSNTKLYDAGLTVGHRGAANAKAAVDWITAQMPAPQRVLITGWTSGAIGATFWTPTIMRAYPAAAVTLLADGLFDLASTDMDLPVLPPGGNITMGLVMSLVGTAMNEWRSKAYINWGVTKDSVFASAFTFPAFTNLTVQWSGERVFSALTALKNPNLQLARFNFATDTGAATILPTILMSSVSAMVQVAMLGVDQKSLSTVLSTSGGGPGLGPYICSLVKQDHVRLLALNNAKYAGFLGSGSGEALLNLNAMYSTTGVNAASANINFASGWLSGLADETSPVITNVFNTACPNA